MSIQDLESLSAVFETWMPWRHPDSFGPWYKSLPTTEREVVGQLQGVLRDGSDRRHVVLIGLRRVGKTVAMQHTVVRLLNEGVLPARILWLRMDHPQVRNVDLGRLVQALVGPPPWSSVEPYYLFLDEVTAAPQWDLWLKTFYDDGWPVRIVATSSATSTHRTVRTESGAGRWREVDLPPWLVHEYGATLGRRLPALAGDLHGVLLSQAEAKPSSDWDASADVLSNLGGFAEGWPTGGDFRTAMVRAQDRLRGDIVHNAIYRDLMLAVGIEQPDKLEQLLTVLADQVAQIASPSALGSSIGVKQPTVDRYLSHLEAIHLVFRLYNYTATEEAVQRRGRKVFLADNAVRNAVLGRVPWAVSDAERGHLRENQVAVHLQVYAARLGQRLYYWREGKQEVDFVLPSPASPIAIEVASSSGHHHGGLKALVERRPEFAGRTWLTWPEAPWCPPERAEDGVGTCPVGWLLALAGRLALG